MKSWSTYLFLLITGLAVAQKPLVILDVEPREAKVGEILTITVKSNVQGELDIELPAGFVHGYNVMNGMEQEMDYATGKVITFYYMSQTGAMNREGSFTFGPAYIKKGSRVYRSNTVQVTIKKDVAPAQASDELSSRQLKQPAFGVIECSRKTVYEGEPIVLNAKVYAHFNPSHLEDYQSYAMDGVIEKHEIGNNQRILVDETTVKGIRLYTFSYDKNVMFPTGTGKVNVDPFKLLLRKGFETVPVTSTSSVIEVKPLPKAPKDFAGGVGTFSISRSISGTSFTQGEVFTMSITVNGKGNLHNLLEPVLQLPKGFIVYGDPVVNENVSFTSRGAEGSVTYEYHIQLTRHGELSLPGTTFSYFDPQKEQYVRISTESHSLKVKEDKNFKPDPGNEKEEQLARKAPEIGPLRSEGARSLPADPFGSSGFLVALGSPLVLSLLLGIMVRRRSLHADPASSTNETAKKSRESSEQLIHEAALALRNGEHDRCGALIEKAVLTYLSSILKIPSDEVSGKAELIDRLSATDNYKHLVPELRSLLDLCEQARYGMASGIIGQGTLDKASNLIKNNR